MKLDLLGTLDRASPALAGAALLAILLTGGVTATPTADVQPYFDRVARVIASTPHKVDRWIGSDVEVQPAAVRLLRPNKLLQRLYVNPVTGESVQLLIVHCGETRDMVGHFPPVCYPGRGWILDGSQQTPITPGELEGSATEYRFRRSVQGVEERMVVTNFFVLPGALEPIAGDMRSVDEASASPIRSVLGAAQVQILTDPAMSEERRAQVVDQFVDAIEDSILAIAVRQADGR